MKKSFILILPICLIAFSTIQCKKGDYGFSSTDTSDTIRFTADDQEMNKAIEQARTSVDQLTQMSPKEAAEVKEIMGWD
ncbi:MAG: hypothetical protein ABUK01_15005 [Leptospirales bacterium]